MFKFSFHIGKYFLTINCHNEKKLIYVYFQQHQWKLGFVNYLQQRKILIIQLFLVPIMPNTLVFINFGSVSTPLFSTLQSSYSILLLVKFNYSLSTNSPYNHAIKQMGESTNVESIYISSFAFPTPTAYCGRQVTDREARKLALCGQ